MNTSSLLNTTPGTSVTVSPDYYILTDGAAKTVPSLLGNSKPARPEAVKVFIDHETPCGSETHAEFQKQLIRFADSNGCELFNGYGTSYQLMLEKYVKLGQIVAICGDFGSIFGAAGAIAVRLTPEEMASAIVCGELAVTAPEICGLNLSGELKSPACAKDAALKAVSILGNTTDKLVLVSGNIPEGAEKIAFFQLISLGGCVGALETEKTPGNSMELNLSEVVPMVGGPEKLCECVPASELSDVAVSSVFIGGCSAGRIEDLRAAAAAIKGRRVQRNVRVLVAPASTSVYIQAANEGLIDSFFDAGALVMNQGCSACFARSQGLVDDKDVVFSSGSRLSPNCMGEGFVPTYIGSAATAMETAITGFVAPAKL